MGDKPFTPRKVINIHTHVKLQDDVPKKVEAWIAQGAVRTCVLCTALPPAQPGWGVYGNREFVPILERYADHIIGFAGLNLSETPDAPAAVGECHKMGFRGLKCIMPARPYDDDLYMPLYEQAAKHRMPLLFHTGSLSFPPAYRGPCRIDFMRPSRIERAARYFPELPVIGAHLGMPWHTEAINLMLSRPNVYFDISGGSGAPLHGTLIKLALSPFAGADWANPDEHLALRLFRERLLFGTDNPPVQKWVVRAENILDHFQIPADVRENYYWKTAAKVLGIDGAV